MKEGIKNGVKAIIIYFGILAWATIFYPAHAATVYEWWGGGPWYSNPFYTTVSGSDMDFDCDAMGGAVSITAFDIPFITGLGSSTAWLCEGTGTTNCSDKKLVTDTGGSWPIQATTTFTFSTPISCSANATMTIRAYGLGVGVNQVTSHLATTSQKCTAYGTSVCGAVDPIVVKITGSATPPPPPPPPPPPAPAQSTDQQTLVIITLAILGTFIVHALFWIRIFVMLFNKRP